MPSVQLHTNLLAEYPCYYC